MIDDIIDQPLRDAVEPTSSTSEKIGDSTITSLDLRARSSPGSGMAPAIFARVPWLFDVPNATTLTIEVSYDESGIVHHLHFGVEPPQPGRESMPRG